MACFTRPEAKVERVSYPVPTPSAARGILEAIFWKPEFSWRVREIAVLRHIRYVGMLRNEVNSKARPGSDGISITDDRAQRHTLALYEVAYVIRADVAVAPGVPEDPAKFRDQFRRRVRNGQCFQRPFAGCREFALDFAEPDRAEAPIGLSQDLGLMLFDIAFARSGSGANYPVFFEAKLADGVLHVPDILYAQREALRP
jgi:CRISPR-associated protein Cas5d